MDCSRLERLGMNFGGADRLQETVDRLSAHHLERGG
jgi:hypothetical protein